MVATEQITQAGAAEVPAEAWLQVGDTLAGFVISEGFNCTSLRVKQGKNWLPVLAEPPNWDAVRGRPSFYGSPLLAPYAYDVHEGELAFEGQRYSIADGKEGRPMHGMSRDHAWTVTDRGQADGKAWLSAHLAVGPGDSASERRLAEFPFPIDMAVTYVLRVNGQVSEMVTRWTVANTGNRNLPLGLGIHPYFDLSPRSGRPDADLLVEGHMRRLVFGRGALSGADGSEDESDRYAQRVDDYIVERERGSHRLGFFERADAPHDDLPESQGAPFWSLTDKGRGLVISLRASAPFRYLLQFVPENHTALSPVVSTNSPHVHHRAAQGLDCGLITLVPGQIWRGWCSIQVETSGTQA